jgi:hypothetical protein
MNNSIHIGPGTIVKIDDILLLYLNGSKIQAVGAGAPVVFDTPGAALTKFDELVLVLRKQAGFIQLCENTWVAKKYVQRIYHEPRHHYGCFKSKYMGESANVKLCGNTWRVRCETEKSAIDLLEKFAERMESAEIA